MSDESPSYHILGIFPDATRSYFETSLFGKAWQGGLLSLEFHQLRHFSQDKHQHVDDKPYGGGAGMVFKPDVVCRAVRELKKKHKIDHVVLTSPAGQPLTPKIARDLAQKKSILFLCPRYEGVDQRAVDLVVDQEISIGDYVLSGGELAATVILDAVARFIPGVVGREESVQKDSFEDGLLEHPHFTTPAEFEGQGVPEVLLSGHHKNIDEWRRKEALQRTWKRRPDLLKKAKLDKAELEFIKDLIHGETKKS